MTTSSIQIAFSADGFPASLLRVIAFTVHEAISTPYRIEVEASPTQDLSGEELMRVGAEVVVSDLDGTVLRRFGGVVSEVTERFRGRGAELRIVIEAPLSVAALSSDCRIFQALSAIDIAKNVLAACGVDVKTTLSGTYQTRVSCTQFKETMLAFVSRLLEEEGVSYVFVENDGALDLTFVDSMSAFPKFSDAISFSEDSGVIELGVVTFASDVASLYAGKMTIGDHDWQKPALDLTSNATDASGLADREHYEFPAGFVVAAEGARRAKNWLAATATEATFTRFRSTAIALSAGHVFTLQKSRVHDGDWLVVEIAHHYREQEGGLGYENELRAVKASREYRPPRRTPRPRIEGPHTAIVTGTSGQEIDVDPNACVKLKFPWDRHSAFDEKSSAWVRVAEIALTGSIHLPRIGWEVLVEFEDGDPDRPVVVGRLFNATYPPPYPLPDNKTRSAFGSYSSPGGKGHNEIRFEDSAGTEHVHIHAQKDLTVNADGNRSITVTTSAMTQVKVDQSVHVKKDLTATVKGKSDVEVSGKQTLVVKKDREKTVKGDEMVTVNGDASLTVKGSSTLSTSGNYTLQAGGDASVTVSGDLDEESDDVMAIAIGGDSELTVGADKTESAKSGRTIAIGGKYTATIAAGFDRTSEKDLSTMVTGKKSSTIGGSLSVTSGDVASLSSGDALAVTAGAALNLNGASGITFKVGSSKVTLANGSIVIDTGTVKITSDGPASALAAIVASK